VKEWQQAYEGLLLGGLAVTALGWAVSAVYMQVRAAEYNRCVLGDTCAVIVIVIVVVIVTGWQCDMCLGRTGSAIGWQWEMHWGRTTDTIGWQWEMHWGRREDAIGWHRTLRGFMARRMTVAPYLEDGCIMMQVIMHHIYNASSSTYLWPLSASHHHHCDCTVAQ